MPSPGLLVKQDGITLQNPQNMQNMSALSHHGVSTTTFDKKMF